MGMMIFCQNGRDTQTDPKNFEILFVPKFVETMWHVD
jgi:hypothetical protein